MNKLEKLKSGSLEIKTNNGIKSIKGKLIEVDNKKFFKIKAKKEYLDIQNPFEKLSLTDKKICIHCGKEFFVGDYQILITENNNDLIVCPNAPECDGTIIDWYDSTLENKKFFNIK